jgi:hypothetical protein
LGSPGRHDKPANGEEAIARPDGSFELTLHAHPGESVTLGEFVDQGEHRHYSKPLVLPVPLDHPKFATGH